MTKSRLNLSVRVVTGTVVAPFSDHSKGIFVETVQSEELKEPFNSISVRKAFHSYAKWNIISKLIRCMPWVIRPRGSCDWLRFAIWLCHFLWNTLSMVGVKLQIIVTCCQCYFGDCKYSCITIMFIQHKVVFLEFELVSVKIN